MCASCCVVTGSRSGVEQSVAQGSHTVLAVWRLAGGGSTGSLQLPLPEALLQERLPHPHRAAGRSLAEPHRAPFLLWA